MDTVTIAILKEDVSNIILALKDLNDVYRAGYFGDVLEETIKNDIVKDNEDIIKRLNEAYNNQEI